MRLALLFTTLLAVVEANRRAPSAPLKADVPRMWGYPCEYRDERQSVVCDDSEPNSKKPLPTGCFDGRLGGVYYSPFAYSVPSCCFSY